MRTAPAIRPPSPLVTGVPSGPQVEAPPPGPRVDPRLSARRIAVRRDAGRRRLRRLAWVGGAALAVAAVLGSTRTPLLDLDHIDVVGADRLGAEGVLAAVADAGIRTGRPLADLDLGDAEAALEALPGVQDAEVVRHWPGRIEVRVIERRPVAAVAVPGGFAVVGADGIVIAVDVAAVDVAAGEGLVLVDGPPNLVAGDRFPAPELVAVAAAMPVSMVPLVAGIGAGTGDGDGEGAVELRVAGGALVRLGAGDELGAKLLAAETVLREVDGTCLAVIDVRVPSAPTVTRQAGC